MRQMIIATHGDFSKGIKQSLQMIAGESADEIITYQLRPGESASDFAEELSKNLASDKQYLILGDLFGASVVNSFVPLTQEQNVFLVSGVNLNLALEFLLTPGELTEDLVDTVISNARDGIKRVQLIEEDNDDFWKWVEINET